MTLSYLHNTILNINANSSINLTFSHFFDLTRNGQRPNAVGRHQIITTVARHHHLLRQRTRMINRDHRHVALINLRHHRIRVGQLQAQRLHLPFSLQRRRHFRFSRRLHIITNNSSLISLLRVQLGALSRC